MFIFPWGWKKCWSCWKWQNVGGLGAFLASWPEGERYGRQWGMSEGPRERMSWSKLKAETEIEIRKWQCKEGQGLDCSKRIYIHTSCKLLQSCLTLCDPMDHSLPGSSVHGILQARILEWVVMPSSRGSSLPRVSMVSCVSFIGRRVVYH